MRGDDCGWSYQPADAEREPLLAARYRESHSAVAGRDDENEGSDEGCGGEEGGVG